MFYVRQGCINDDETVNYAPTIKRQNNPSLCINIMTILLLVKKLQLNKVSLTFCQIYSLN